MPYSTFGEVLRVTTFGESHGAGVGVVIDGIPSGLEINEEVLQKELDRRRPGTSKFVTPRKEADSAEILSGVANGRTLGTPLAILVRNTNQRSKDYGDLLEKFRPSHADFSYFKKYGTAPQPGGGRSSGRETIGRVAAGAVARVILGSRFKVESAVSVVGRVEGGEIDFAHADRKDNPLRFADPAKQKDAEDEVWKAMQNHDSVGGEIELKASGVPAGLGEPVFDKLDARLGAALFSIGGIKSVEIGAGAAAAMMYGSEYNDEIVAGGEWVTNNSGGVLGGISTGQDIILSIAVKPTPSISQLQNTINLKEEATTVEVKGRHDPCLCPRVAVVAEAMVAITLADFLLLQRRF